MRRDEVQEGEEVGGVAAGRGLDGGVGDRRRESRASGSWALSEVESEKQEPQLVVVVVVRVGRLRLDSGPLARVRLRSP